MKLILVRHGESVGNAQNVLQGRLDFALSDRGLVQAERTAVRLAAEPVDRVLSSPLLRASATAALIAQALDVTLELEPALAEYDIGEASGLQPHELRARFPEMLSERAAGRRFTFPGEEGRANFHARLREALDRLSQDTGTLVAVAHGGVISALCHMVVGLDLHGPGRFQVGNCSITEITTDRAGRLVLARHNDMCHLGELATTVDRG